MKQSLSNVAIGSALLLPFALILSGCGGGSATSVPTPTTAPTTAATTAPTTIGTTVPTTAATTVPTTAATTVPTTAATTAPTATPTPRPTATPRSNTANIKFSRLGADAPSDTSPIIRPDYTLGSDGFIGRNSGYTLASFHIQQGGTGYNSGSQANPARVIEIRINIGRGFQKGDVFPIAPATAPTPTGAAFLTYSVLTDGTVGRTFGPASTMRGTITIENTNGPVTTVLISNASLAPTPQQTASFALNGRFTLYNTQVRQ